MIRSGKITRRVLMAVTETGPIRRMWQETLEILDRGEMEVVALFIADERWDRAASLPFTREILLVSGAVRDFTAERAREVTGEAAERARKELEGLAAEANFPVVFEDLSRSNHEKIISLISDGNSVVVAPSSIIGTPVYAVFKKLPCEIVLVESSPWPDWDWQAKPSP